MSIICQFQSIYYTLFLAITQVSHKLPTTIVYNGTLIKYIIKLQFDFKINLHANIDQLQMECTFTTNDDSHQLVEGNTT